MKNCLRLACFLFVCAYPCLADTVYKTSPACHGCPERIVIQASLAQAIEIWDCKAVSGMTCRIGLRSDAKALPSEIFIGYFGPNGQKIGTTKRLIYPNLKRGEKGWATFNLVAGELKTVRLTGRWDGPWKNPY
jgi:hypothetical protein